MGNTHLDKLLEHDMKPIKTKPEAVAPMAPQKVTVVDKDGNIATPWDKDVHAWTAKGWTVKKTTPKTPD